MALKKPLEYTVDGEGRIIEAKNENAAVSVKWENSSAELIKYANFIISEVCLNRGIAAPERATE